MSGHVTPYGEQVWLSDDDVYPVARCQLARGWVLITQGANGLIRRQVSLADLVTEFPVSRDHLLRAHEAVLARAELAIAQASVHRDTRLAEFHGAIAEEPRQPAGRMPRSCVDCGALVENRDILVRRCGPCAGAVMAGKRPASRLAVVLAAAFDAQSAPDAPSAWPDDLHGTYATAKTVTDRIPDLSVAQVSYRLGDLLRMGLITRSRPWPGRLAAYQVSQAGLDALAQGLDENDLRRLARRQVIALETGEAA